ncbi:MAG TPA: glycosyltransferase family 87 protein [Vicinamibacterales bacterium]|nr:glycosyltransferase family 87 protein [Vicinamibacterales bacterium]
MRTRVLLGVLALVSLVAVFTTRVSRKMPDFEVYWTAGARAAAAQPLYRESDGHYQFKYLPAFALLAVPLAAMPLAAAKGAWFAASAVAMVVLLGLSLRALPNLRRPPILLLVLTFLAMAKFYAHELVLGQVNLLFAVLAALAVVWMRRGREAGAGLLLALAVVVKPYAVIFAPWLATRRRRGALLAMTAGLVVLLLLPAARYGWEGNLRLLGDWWRTVTTTSAPNVLNQDNVSLGAMFAKWIGPDSAAAILAAAAGGILLLLAAIVMAGRGQLKAPDTLEAGLLLLLIPLLSPQGWDYVFLIATPAVMLLIDELPALPRELRYAATASIAAIALSIFDLMGREAYATFMQLSLITVFVLVEYAALVTLRFRRAA